MAKNTPKTGIELNQHHQYIHLTVPNGNRVLCTFKPHGVRTCPTTGRVYATANLFGRIYKVRMQDTIPAYRVCKENGEYDNVIFPEAQEVYDRANRPGRRAPVCTEEFLAPPYSWGED